MGFALLEDAFVALIALFMAFSITIIKIPEDFSQSARFAATRDGDLSSSGSTRQLGKVSAMRIVLGLFRRRNL